MLSQPDDLACPELACVRVAELGGYFVVRRTKIRLESDDRKPPHFNECILTEISTLERLACYIGKQESLRMLPVILLIGDISNVGVFTTHMNDGADENSCGSVQYPRESVKQLCLNENACSVMTRPRYLSRNAPKFKP